MANLFSVCALVQTWRVKIPDGGTEAHGERIPDPFWSVIVNKLATNTNKRPSEQVDRCKFGLAGSGLTCECITAPQLCASDHIYSRTTHNNRTLVTYGTKWDLYFCIDLPFQVHLGNFSTRPALPNSPSHPVSYIHPRILSILLLRDDSYNHIPDHRQFTGRQRPRSVSL